MASTGNIIIKNLAAVDKTFVPAVAVPNGTQYRETSSPVTGPLTLDVTHKFASASSTSNNAHSVRFQKIALNGSGQVRSAYINISISVPKDGVTPADVSDLGAFMRYFLSDAGLNDLLLGKY